MGRVGSQISRVVNAIFFLLEPPSVTHFRNGARTQQPLGSVPDVIILGSNQRQLFIKQVVYKRTSDINVIRAFYAGCHGQALPPLPQAPCGPTQGSFWCRGFHWRNCRRCRRR